jgi:putative endonuclease
MRKRGYVYIMTNKHNTVLYVGMTSVIHHRIKQHKEKVFKNSFTAKYNLNKLVYFEEHSLVVDAIHREKQLKAGSRKKKELLVKTMNPHWRDLAADWFE